MGAWGGGSFQNDWALDWLAKLQRSKDASLVRGALSLVVQHGGTKHSPPSLLERLRGRRHHTDWLKASVATKALAAAEVVAAWKGCPSGTLPDGLTQWLKQYASSLPPDLIPLAQQAVIIVKSNSELKELWEEGDSAEWKEAIDDLQRRLSTKP